ncbi:MAG: DciA family protein [Candidatus Omnitrophica bacterium]|nr:DciA family protein [Candidatus Omnitrophota bacterium]
MEKIKDTLQSVMQDLVGQKGRAPGEDPEGWLRKVLTKRELGHIKLQYFRKGILGILVDSSVWLYSLNLKKEDLLRKLKKCSGQIQEIRLTIGEIR